MPSIAKTRRPRDARVDLLRGIALLMIFVDHIPDNFLATATLHNFGFSDAAEIFVLLAGFSTATAYGGLIDGKGLRAGIVRVGRRVACIYGIHVALFLGTLGLVLAWSHAFGLQPRAVRPLLEDGWSGVARGLTLSALPTYLDILPLYIVLLAAFPLLWLGARKNLVATLFISFCIYAFANVTHLDLPNIVDRSDPRGWYFNPFTWQLVFACGMAGAIWSRRGPLRLPPAVNWIAAAYLLFAFWANDAWQLWPAPFAGFPGLSFPFALFGNEPKSFVTPWRLLHAVALTVLVLQSPQISAWSQSAWLRPVVAAGRHSLLVFAAGCALALLGRLFLLTVGPHLLAEAMVDALGLTIMLFVGMSLEHARVSHAQEKGKQQRRDDDRLVTAGQPLVRARDIDWQSVYQPGFDLGGDFGRLASDLSFSLQSLTDAPDDTRRLTADARARPAA